MLTREPPADVQRHLQDVEHRLAALTAEQRTLEGRRDTLIRQLVDCDGAHDRRPVAVR
jgi:hypothetical protein